MEGERRRLQGVCKNVPTIEIEAKDFPQYCQKGSCYDEVMLEGWIGRSRR